MIWFMMYYMIGLAITISVVHSMQEKPFSSSANILATLLTAIIWLPAAIYASFMSDEEAE